MTKEYKWAIIDPFGGQGVFDHRDNAWHPWIFESGWSEDDQVDMVSEQLFRANDGEWEYPDDVVLALRRYPCSPPPKCGENENAADYAKRLQADGWTVLRVRAELERRYDAEEWDGKE